MDLNLPVRIKKLTKPYDSFDYGINLGFLLTIISGGFVLLILSWIFNLGFIPYQLISLICITGGTLGMIVNVFWRM